MKLSPAQHGVLHQLKEFGAINTTEVLGPPNMAGVAKAKLETTQVTAATINTLVGMGLVAVSRGEVYRPKDATGRPGNKRRNVCISITADGLGAI